MKIFILVLFTLLLFPKKAFQLEDAMNFESIRNYDISDDGKWFYYITKPDLGNSKAIIKNVETDTETTFERISSVAYSDNFETIILKRVPDIVDKANDKKKKLKDSLVIFQTKNSKTEIVPNTHGFDISNNGIWLEFSRDINDDKEYFLKHIESGTEIFIDDVKESAIDSAANHYFYIKENEENTVNGIYYRDLNQDYSPEKIIETDSNAVYSGFSWNENQKVLAFKKAELDSNDKPKDYQLLVWKKNTQEVNIVVKDSLIKNWYLPKKTNLSWTQDGKRLWFGMKPESERYNEDEDEDDKITSKEFYEFDHILSNTQLYLWHWKDEKIITEQQTNWNRRKDNTYDAIYHLENDKVLKLADTNLAEVSYTNNQYRSVAYDTSPYEKLTTWDYWYYDLYIIDISTGVKTKIAEKLTSSGYISPNGNYVAYFKDDEWYLYDYSTNTSRNLTDNIKTSNFEDVLNDRPRPNGSYGFGGWFEDEKSFIIYDRFDLWKVSSENGAMFNMMQGDGNLTKTEYRIRRFRGDEEYLSPEKDLFIEGFNTIDKSRSLYGYLADGRITFKREEINSSFVRKAKNSDALIVKKQSYNIFPDLHLTTSNLESFKNLTNLHPEIQEYNWGKTEMVKYTTKAGDTLQGYVIKPDDFDPNKKYPLFVYFYERFSDRRHQFSTPQINHRPVYPYYVGKGYCMFFPDIKFYEGNPGASGLDAVVSGCEELISKGYIDKEKIAIHGHSWSGYQSAFFVTQTDFFAACVTGAPVSNMTSAYSGIRLGSGLARQFQYESTQSRIGGNIVDSLDSYIRNSPVFFADKMNTPTLIMFGDIDDAVPWQQGVELFLAFRRFDKPAILLQYENEPHHLRKYHNKLDYAIRMSEFFDHFVLDKPAPDWIIEGIKYKGTYNTGNN